MDLKKLERLSVGNAAGTVRTVEGVKKLLGSAVTRIKVGSMTRKPRSGNLPIPGGRTYYYNNETMSTLNALGMPNVGIDEFEKLLPEMVSLAHAAGKELWVSVAGEYPEEFSELAEICFAAGADGVELNLGCPNVHDGGVSKPIFSYHPELVEEVLDLMTMRFYGQNRKISVKISPVPNDVLAKLARVINSNVVVTEVTATNTLPNQEMKDGAGSPALSFTPPGGNEVLHKGGLAGPGLRPDALRVVSQLRSHAEKARSTLFGSLKLTVVGGIASGEDLMEYFKVTDEIDGIEVGSAYFESEDPSIFTSILTQFVRLAETV